MSKSNSFLVGQFGEQATQQYYQRRGYTILVKSFFNHKGKRFGEIDFIALKGRSIYFVEVKTRTSQIFASALEFVDKRKRARIQKNCRIFFAMP